MIIFPPIIRYVAFDESEWHSIESACKMSLTPHNVKTVIMAVVDGKLEIRKPKAKS